MSKFWTEIDVGEQNERVFSCDWVDDQLKAIIEFSAEDIREQKSIIPVPKVRPVYFSFIDEHPFR